MNSIKQYRNLSILSLVQMIANVICEVLYYETSPQCNKDFMKKINIQHQCSLSEVLTQCAKDISVSNNPLIRLQNAAIMYKISIDPRKKMIWGFLSMQHQNSFAMQLTPNYFLGKLMLERMFSHVKAYNWHLAKILVMNNRRFLKHLLPMYIQFSILLTNAWF